jgi:tetratricopeptide (TPR) repeat protein
MGLISSEDAAVHLRPAMERANELGEDLWEVRYASALAQGWWAWNWEECVADYQRAFELNPNSPDAHAYYSQILLILQQEEEAVEHINRALELDPLNPLFQVVYAMDLNFLRRPADAEEVLLEILDMDPNHPMALSTLRTTYHLLGRHEEAIEMWRASYIAAGKPEAVQALDRGYAEGGYSAALTAVAETLARQAEVTFVPAWQIGTLHTRAGNSDAALDWLERAFEERGPNLPYLAIDPIFDDIRPDPRFQSLLQRLDLSE